jgi:glycine betaine/choline ABC-type transport system substrate-binding protein
LTGSNRDRFENFTEQVILGELLAQKIERSTRLPVERRLNLGGTLICHQAIVAGQIDAYVEYTGTALTAILKEPTSTDAKQVYERVRKDYRDQFKIEWTEPLGFNNTFVIVVRGDDAQTNLKTI